MRRRAVPPLSESTQSALGPNATALLCAHLVQQRLKYDLKHTKFKTFGVQNLTQKTYITYCSTH